jgi:hypothetical protein
MFIGFALAIRSGVQYWTAALASASEEACPGLGLAAGVVGSGKSSRAAGPAVAGETTNVEKIKNAANTGDNAAVDPGFRIIVRTFLGDCWSRSDVAW